MNASDTPFRWFNVNVCKANETYDSTELLDRIGSMELEAEARIPVGKFDRELVSLINPPSPKPSLLCASRLRMSSQPPWSFAQARLTLTLMAVMSQLRPMPEEWRASLGAVGEVLSREVWGQRDFRTSFNFVRHFELAPGSSLSCRRNLVEEVLIVLGGEGVITVEDDAMPVRTGTLLRNPRLLDTPRAPTWAL